MTEKALVVQEFKLQDVRVLQAIRRPHPAGIGGEQIVVRFHNEYGASVIQSPFSYGGERGLWELGIIKFHGPNIDDYKLTHDTHITDDVIGDMSVEDLREVLLQIAALPA